ncbi:MAG: hypothetical protein U0168_08345 [Nannocystaceae bacterium]
MTHPRARARGQLARSAGWFGLAGLLACRNTDVGGGATGAAESGSSSAASEANASEASQSGDSESGSASWSSSDTGVSCNPEMPPLALQVLRDSPMGIISSFDMDLDRRPDAVGGRGVIVLDRGDGTEVRALEHALAANDGMPGDFVDGGLPDLMFKPGVGEEFLVFSNAAEDISSSGIGSYGPSSWSADSEDFDGDGVDDVALALDGGDTVGLWRGQGDGSFNAGPEISGLQTPVVALVRYGMGGRVHLALTPTFEEVAIYEIVADALLEVDGFPLLGVSTMADLDAFGNGDHGIFASWWFAGDLQVRSGVGVLLREPDDWVGFAHDLGGEVPVDQVPVDLDQDGDLDIVVAVAQEGGHRIDLACLQDDGYMLCGRIPLDVEPVNLGVLVDPPRLLLSTSSSTWLAELPEPACAAG